MMLPPIGALASRKRQRQDGPGFHSWCDHLRAGQLGPADFAGLCKWPSQIVESLLANGEMKARLTANCRTGLGVASNYSGTRTPENSLYACWPLIPGANVFGLHFVYSCDSSKLCSQVCVESSCASDHHFGT